MAGLKMRGHCTHDIDHREWFLQVIDGAQLHCFQVATHIMVSGHYDDWTVAVPGDGTLQHHLTVEVRPALADNNAFKVYAFQETRGLYEIRTSCYVKTDVVEHPTIVVPVSNVLIDQENSDPAEGRFD